MGTRSKPGSASFRTGIFLIRVLTYPSWLQMEIPATATSSLRAPSELPESFQRAFSSWANYSSLELLVKTPICHLLLRRHYFHRQVSLFDSLLVLPCVFAFLQVWKIFLAFYIDKFNKTCSRFICSVEQFDVFLVCVFLLSYLCYCCNFASHEITNMQKQLLFLSWFTMESPSWLIIRREQRKH